jgi:hypothetical protein
MSSRPYLGPTQLPKQCAPVVLSLGGKGGQENVELYIHSPSRLHEYQTILSQLSPLHVDIHPCCLLREMQSCRHSERPKPLSASSVALGKFFAFTTTNKQKQTPWPESASELYRPSDRCLSAKSVPTFVDSGCHVVNVTEPYSHNLGFLDRSRYFYFQVSPQLYSRG